MLFVWVDYILAKLWTNLFILMHMSYALRWSKCIFHKRLETLESKRIWHMHLDALYAYSICSWIIKAHMAYSARISLVEPQNVWSQTVRQRNVWKQNVQSTKGSATKRPAMKHLDQCDHIQYKYDNKTVNFTFLSKCIWHTY